MRDFIVLFLGSKLKGGQKDTIYSIVNIYTVNLNSDLTILEFKEMTEEWLEFIVNCRNHKKHDYDIVIGAMANDQIYNYIND